MSLEDKTFFKSSSAKEDYIYRNITHTVINVNTMHEKSLIKCPIALK